VAELRKKPGAQVALIVPAVSSSPATPAVQVSVPFATVSHAMHLAGVALLRTYETVGSLAKQVVLTVAAVVCVEASAVHAVVCAEHAMQAAGVALLVT
jgi:hypothetical protein